MNITSENNSMGNILDASRDLEQEWESDYRELKKLISRTEEEERMYHKLKVRLGYVSQINNDIECFGCGS
jgi:hypothetical protein